MKGMLMLATAVVLAGALAGAPVPAAASPLDYQGLAFQSGSIGTGGSTVLSTPAYASSSSHPIRHRRPYHDRDRYRDSYDNYEPHYFAALGGGNFDPDDQPGNGLWLNGELGTEVGDAVDLGVRMNLYHRESGHSQVVSQFTDPAGNVGQRVIETSNIETNLVPLMAILRVRFPVSRDFQPYAGGGVGWEWLTVNGTDTDGFDFQDDYDGFGAQLFGGLNLGVSPNLAVYGEALWNKSTVSAEFFDSDPLVNGNVRDEIDVDGLGIHGGLRFRF